MYLVQKFLLALEDICGVENVILAIYIRELVDSLCRDETDAPMA